MNLYLVFAIALGAISGVVEVPAARPAASSLMARRASESSAAVRQRLAIGVGAPHSRAVLFSAPAKNDRTAFGVPNTSARPRAPAAA